MSWWPILWAYGLLAILVVAGSVTDVKSGKIPNLLTYPAALVGLAGHGIAGGLWGHGVEFGLMGSLLGLTVGYVPMLLARELHGVGGGDAKLMGAIGALAGWRFALSAMFFGLLASAVLAVIVMIRKKVVKRTFLRLARFARLALLPGGVVDPVREDSPQVPMGLAFCIGCAAAMAEALCRGPEGPKWLLGI